MDSDTIDKLSDIGFDKANNKLFKKVNKENSNIIDKLDIKNKFETAEIIIDINNDSAQIITYLDEKKSMVNDIIGQDFNELIEKLLN